MYYLTGQVYIQSLGKGMEGRMWRFISYLYLPGNAGVYRN